MFSNKCIRKAKCTKKTENDIFGGEDFRVESVGGRWRHQPAAPGADADADAPSIHFAFYLFCIFFTCADADVDAHADVDADAPSILFAFHLFMLMLMRLPLCFPFFVSFLLVLMHLSHNLFCIFFVSF